MKFKLDVDDAIVTVWQTDDGFWRWSFTHIDGSCNHSDSDWNPTERGTKKEAVDHYRYRKGKYGKREFRARWIKVEEHE